MVRTYFVIIIILLSVKSLEAKTLYVNGATGNDSTTYANNDANNPWLTLGRAVWGQSTIPSPYPAINTTAEAAQAGDTVIISAGTYSTTQAVGNRAIPIYKPVNEGSAGNYITFQASGKVILESNTSGVGEPIIGSQDRDYIIWDGFSLDEANIHTKQDTGPVVAFGSSFVTIRNCTIIGTYNAWNDNHVGIRLENSSDITIYNNDISKFRYYATSNDSQNCTGIETYNTDRVTIYNNTIHDCGSGMYIKQENAGPYYIYKNLIYNTGHGIFVQQLTSGKIYQNVIYDTNNGFKIQSYASAYGPDNLDIVNNTVDNACGPQGACYIRSLQYSENIRIYNNIFSNSTEGIPADGITTSVFDTSISFEHNHYSSSSNHANVQNTNYTISTWRTSMNQDTATGNGRVGEESPPGYRNRGNKDFRLTVGANPEDGGVDILDLDNDGLTTDAIHRGAYITGNEQIGKGGLAAPILHPPH